MTTEVEEVSTIETTEESVTYEHFDFDADFQTKVAALVLRDDQFLSRTSLLMRPEFFENSGEAALVNIALKHYNKYGCAPDSTSLVKAIRDAVSSKALRSDIVPLVVEARKAILVADISNRDFVEDNVVAFAKQQSLIQAVMKTAEMINAKKYEKIEATMTEALSVGVNEDGVDYDYFDVDRITERAVLRIEKESGIRPPQGITTGDYKFDNLLYHRGWGRKELSCLMGGAKSGKCVTRDTLIFTENGLSEIGSHVPVDLDIDTFKPHVINVLGKDGLEPTSHVYNSGLSSTIKLTVSKGLSIEGTYHHPMLTINEKGEHEWKRLDQIKRGDYLVGQRNQQIYGCRVDLTKYAQEACQYQASLGEKCNGEATFPKVMTVELAEWLAMFIAEGYCGSKAKMTFTQKDKTILNRFVSLAKHLFNIDFKMSERANKTPEVKAHSASLQRYLESLGVVWSTSKYKVVPHAVLSAPRDVVIAFLAPLIGLEGCISKHSKNKVTFDLCMASEKLIRQVNMLLLNEGVVSKYSTKMAQATNGVRIMRPYYRLAVSGVRNLACLKKIGVYEKRKNDILYSVNTDQQTTQRLSIPHAREWVGKVMVDIQTAGHFLKGTFDSSFYRTLRTIRSGRSGEPRHLTYDIALRLLACVDALNVKSVATEHLRAIARDDYFYSEVTDIDYGEELTVDLTVPKTHSFFANGLISHNTAAMVHFARMASLAGHNVLYVTLEVGASIIADRLDAAMTGTLMKELGKKATDVAKTVKAMSAKAGAFELREFASGTFTPNELKNLIQKYKSPRRKTDGTIRPPIKFDLIVVDYADIMAPNHRTTDAMENSKSIYIDLRAIAFEENVAMLTATQPNREGFKSAVAKAEHVADDFNKVRTVDLMISINKTEEEASRGEARFYFAASRNQESGFTVVVKQNLAMMRFVESVVRVE